ncbi:hypothetical protein BGZ70_000267 [Mortierella alpina]|uniref:Uncharacterized protein n=1 Tax=Mortierella alpina TaxID=64518 RepID=A0A9P6IY47_MORAP|nr:hypothetical protein BGZ70_000267 [Mortierella alpina]
MTSIGDDSVHPGNAGTKLSDTLSSAAREPGIETWDVNDPALSLGTFFNSPAWENQSFIPGSDFVNLLRVLRPVDHAFYIHLFSSHSFQKPTIVTEQDTSHSSKFADPPSMGDGDDQGCGPWIQDYIEFQHGILDRTLPPRYTIHSCSDKQAEASTSDPLRVPCGNVFSQMVAMTAAFSWSVTEARGFFLRPDQALGLQESFQTPLVQLWASPPKPESRAKINTEGWTDEYISSAFGLYDPLFDNEDKELSTEEGLQSKLRDLKSKSRNRASFERELSNDRSTRLDDDTLAAKTSSTAQKPHRRRQNASTRQGSTNEQQMGGLELVLSRDILPQLVNTTRTLSLFLNLGLPLPDRILQQIQERPGRVADPKRRHPDIIRVGHSSHVPSAIASSRRHANAYHAAIHDRNDPSRIQAVPKTFGCMLDILIQPHMHLQQLMHPYATLFQLPAIFSVGIYIQSTMDSSRSRDRELIVDRYLTCARQIAREFAPKRQGQKIVFVVVSEDASLARTMESQETWDEEVITPNWVTPKDSDHQHHSYDHRQQQKRPTTELTEQQRAVMENWILSKTDYQVVSDNSAFAKVAVWRTRRENQSVMIQDSHPTEPYDGGAPGPDDDVDMLDCGTLLRNRPGSN